LFYARSECAARRAATQIHDRSGRWALVSIGDLDEEILASPSSWADLCGITIFIPDIGRLAIESQIWLCERLEGGRRADSPLLIACARQPAGELARSNRVLPSFLERFAIEG
jgi:hypothetical protein